MSCGHKESPVSFYEQYNDSLINLDGGIVVTDSLGYFSFQIPDSTWAPVRFLNDIDNGLTVGDTSLGYLRIFNVNQSNYTYDWNWEEEQKNVKQDFNVIETGEIYVNGQESKYNLVLFENDNPQMISFYVTVLDTIRRRQYILTLTTEYAKDFKSRISNMNPLIDSFKISANDFDETIITVVKAFKEKDASTLNDLINNDIGLIILFRRGIPDEYEKTDKIDFEQPIPGYLPYSDFSTDYQIKYQSLPLFDCNSMKWSKSGLYCDTIHIDHLLSTIALNLEANKGVTVPESDIEKFIDIENKSRRIVLSDEDGGELVFYLTMIDDKWYLTILDRVTSDCSA